MTLADLTADRADSLTLADLVATRGQHAAAEDRTARRLALSARAAATYATRAARAR